MSSKDTRVIGNAEEAQRMLGLIRESQLMATQWTMNRVEIDALSYSVSVVEEHIISWMLVDLERGRQLAQATLELAHQIQCRNQGVPTVPEAKSKEFFDSRVKLMVEIDDRINFLRSTPKDTG